MRLCEQRALKREYFIDRVISYDSRVGDVWPLQTRSSS